MMHSHLGGELRRRPLGGSTVLLWILFGLGLTLLSVRAATSPESEADALLSQRVDPDGSGVAVLVSQDGKILFEHAYGFADIARKVPVTTQTRFRIGSVTKQFTAAAVLKLQEAGKLNVTDKLSKYFPDFPKGDQITLQQLLTHTSGVHSYTSQPDFSTRVLKPIEPSALVEEIKSYPLDFKPGSGWSYSNSGYFLLGQLVEKVSGRSYETFLQEQFFTPLQMKDTGVFHNGTEQPGQASGYSYQGGNYTPAPDWQMGWAGGAGCLYSTVEDLNLWNEALFNGRVFSAENLKAALTGVPTSSGAAEKGKKGPGYGYGLGIDHFRGLLEVGHGGGLDGFICNLARIPEEKLNVVVLTNAFPPKPKLNPAVLSHELIALFLADKLAPPAVAPTEISLTAGELDDYVGRYDYGRAILTVSRAGDQLYAQIPGQPRHEIFARAKDHFFWKAVDARVDFERDAAGQVVRAVHHQGGRELVAPRLAPETEVKLADAQLDALLGEYRLTSAATMKITRQGDKLFGQLTGQMPLELGATSETELFVRDVNAHLSFAKDAAGKVTSATLQQNGKAQVMPRL